MTYPLALLLIVLAIILVVFARRMKEYKNPLWWLPQMVGSAMGLVSFFMLLRLTGHA